MSTVVILQALLWGIPTAGIWAFGILGLRRLAAIQKAVGPKPPITVAQLREREGLAPLGASDTPNLSPDEALLRAQERPGIGEGL